MDRILDFIKANKDRYIEELRTFLSFPSISTSPEYKKDILQCAEYVNTHLRSIGMNNVAVMQTGGHPVVYADWLNAGPEKPTVLVYGHYDVQPVDPVELWTTPPFQASIRDGNIFARGAADDKGQVFIHFKALEAHLRNYNSLPVNIKLLIEGEEEIGSVHLTDFISRNRGLLECDVAVISDTAMFDKEYPAIGYGLRGLCYMQVEVTGPNRDLHSGGYGGSVENPINALARIITSMKDGDGKITIEGFYDDIAAIDEKEKEEFKLLPFDEEKFMRDLGIDKLEGEKGYTTLERLWIRPTLDCNGIWGGFTGEGAKTVLPSKAYAKISMRLVPDQDPDKIAALFEKHVIKVSPPTVKVKVRALHHGKPAVTSRDSKWVNAAFDALRKGFGKNPVFIREGGSIPIVEDFKELLDVPTVLLGFGLPDENAHSPDEHFSIDNFFRGIITTSIFYHELGNLKN